MSSSLIRTLSGLIVAVALLSTAIARAADNPVLAEFYGAGVHNYFAGNLAQADSDLTAAINGGSKDPRVYYFRALIGMKTGRGNVALTDLQKGAALEVADVNQFYPVGKSLERVQGSARMTIERTRALARAESHQRKRQHDLMRYEERQRAEPQVLRSPAAAPPAKAPADAGKPAAPATADDDPFAEKADEKSPDAAEDMPADDKPADADKPADGDSDPFAEPEAKAAGDEPKSTDDATTEEVKTDEAGDAAAPADDAGAKGDDEQDPFADEPKEEK